jgi:putative heme transporter
MIPDDLGDPSEASAGLPTRLPPWVVQLGVAAWSFVGLVVATGVIVTALAAVSEVTLPLVLAALLAVEVKPWADGLRRWRLGPGLAAGGVTLGLLLAGAGVAVAAVAGVVDQSHRIDLEVDRAIGEAGAGLADGGLGDEAVADVEDTAHDAADTVRALAPMIGAGLMTLLVSGVGTIVGFASGVILGALVMYYLVKDGTRIRRAVVDQFAPARRAEVDAFVGEACDILRRYWAGRTTMSVIVAAVIGGSSALLGLPLLLTIVAVNFVGGYIPYVGAFIGGALAVIVALGSNGPAAALLMLVIVLAANLLLENLVEPRIMGGRLELHPLLILIVTALGGVIGGIVGLLLAVPTTAVALRLIDRLRASGLVNEVAASIEIIRRG